MKAGEYDALASRTEADCLELIERVQNIQSIGPQGTLRFMPQQDSADLIHGIMGLAGELQELQRLGDETAPGLLSRESVLKEIGDAWWYARFIFRCFDLDIGRAVLRVATKAIEPTQEADFILNVDMLLEPLKKWLFYGKPLNEEEILGETIALLAHASVHDMEIEGETGITKQRVEEHLEAVWELNIAKLKRRYPDRFDATLAQNHDSE